MVQVIPKAAVKREPAIKRILPWLSFLLLVIVVALYFIFSHQVTKTGAALDQAEQELAQVQTEQQLELEKKILTFKMRVDDVIKLLKEKEKISDFFEFLETFVHPNLYFTSLSLTMEGERAALEGTSDDFTTLGQQIFAFEQEPFIEKAKLSNITLSQEGKIEFSIELSLASKETGKKSSK